MAGNRAGTLREPSLVPLVSCALVENPFGSSQTEGRRGRHDEVHPGGR
jgi:hypothetical protein